MQDYRNLQVWKESKDFAVAIYLATEAFPKSEQFGITSQIRRAAISISLNLAEGSGRDTDGEFLRFVRIAKGSLNEAETLLMISADLHLIGTDQEKELSLKASEIGKRLRNLARKLENDIDTKQPKQAKPST